MSPRYRPHIDGLRAAAIVPVILFHTNVHGFHGGFFGVDIFFVISGFLITRIIADEVDAGCFSILGFYERRIRRIVPALLLVMVAVLAVSSLVMFPDDYESAVRSVMAALLFSSNILFYREASYFGSLAHDRPMLHSWSLGVEEQFYIAFPILLILIHRCCPRFRIAILAGLFAGSLALSTIVVGRDPDFAFYMIPARAWELLAGSLLALAPPPAAGGKARDAAALCGLALLVLSIGLYDDKLPFQGIAALPPVAGAALLIRYGEGTMAGRLLSLRPIVFIGLISYSLYLWHWPVIVFSEYVRDKSLHGASVAAAIAVSFGLAVLSWRFVERPFRSPSQVPRRQLLGQVGLASAMVLLASGVAQAGGGWPGRFAPAAVHYAAFATASSPLREACHELSARTIIGPPCRLGADLPPRIAVWGDSHGVELAYALGALAQRRRQSLWQLTASSCPPVVGVDLPNSRNCRAHNDAVLDLLSRARGIDGVVLAGFWASRQYRDTPGLAAGLERAVERLRAMKKRVILVGPVPPNHVDVPRHLAHLAERGALASASGISVSELAEETRYLAATFAAIKARGATIAFPASTLCPGGNCRIVDRTGALYFDAQHLSLAGARLVAAAAAPVIFAGDHRSASR